MITIDDLIHLPYTADLSEGGVTYACRSLPHLGNTSGSSSSDDLRSLTAGVAVELALRRYLTRQNIPFNVKSPEPFTDPYRYDISLGGHRCDLKSFLISKRSQITALRGDLGLALAAPALVPLDQFSTDGNSANDLFLFAFLAGLIAISPADLKKVAGASQPTYLLHTLPDSWVRPQAWIPLGPLTLKSGSEEILNLEIGGLDKSREFLTCSLDLLPRTPVMVNADFYSLSYVHVKSKPGARMSISSPSRKVPYLISSTQWSNIWIYGMDIYLAGWISRSEFRSRASLIPEGSQVFQSDRTHTKNLALSISELKPLSELFERVREWNGLK